MPHSPVRAGGFPRRKVGNNRAMGSRSHPTQPLSKRVRQMKHLLIASLSALALLASGTAFAKDAAKKGGKVMTKSDHVSQKHTCMKDGAEIKTSDKYKGTGG